MFVEQRRWTRDAGWRIMRAHDSMTSPQLVVFFCTTETDEALSALDELRATYPTATLFGCSTAGEICGTEVTDGAIVATAIRFEHTHVASAYRALGTPQASRDVGERLARDLRTDGLAHVLVLAEGLLVNGSELVEGLRAGLPDTVAITGGLAGDGDRFAKTSVWLGDRAEVGGVAVVGLYGSRLRVGYGSMGGWDRFGPERLVTRSSGNVLYELDGGSALDLYRKYLGPYAAELPASGLMFPLSLRGENGDPGVVRTILGVDDQAGSLTFAGDVPQGRYVQLMRANVDRLIDGASGAASDCAVTIGATPADLAILISCVGRKLVLKQRVEEEVESVHSVLGAQAALCGFYSYGEIAPFISSVRCELHNQTMTITTMAEV